MYKIWWKLMKNIEFHWEINLLSRIMEVGRFLQRPWNRIILFDENINRETFSNLFIDLPIRVTPHTNTHTKYDCNDFRTRTSCILVSTRTRISFFSLKHYVMLRKLYGCTFHRYKPMLLMMMMYLGATSCWIWTVFCTLFYYYCYFVFLNYSYKSGKTHMENERGIFWYDKHDTYTHII